MFPCNVGHDNSFRKGESFLKNCSLLKKDMNHMYSTVSIPFLPLLRKFPHDRPIFHPYITWAQKWADKGGKGPSLQACNTGSNINAYGRERERDGKRENGKRKKAGRKSDLHFVPLGSGFKCGWMALDSFFFLPVFVSRPVNGVRGFPLSLSYTPTRKHTSLCPVCTVLVCTAFSSTNRSFYSMILCV